MRARKQPAILVPLSPGRRARARHLLAAYVAAMNDRLRRSEGASE